MSSDRLNFITIALFACTLFFVEIFYREEFLKMKLNECQHREKGDRTFSPSIDRAFKASAIVKIIRNSHIFRRQLPTRRQRYQDPRWYRYGKPRKEPYVLVRQLRKRRKKLYLLKTTCFPDQTPEIRKRKNLTNSWLVCSHAINTTIKDIKRKVDR